MSFLSPNHSLVTDSECTKGKGLFRHTQQGTRIPTPKGKDDSVSTSTFGESTKMHKLGDIPSYLKKQTKSSVESDLLTKYRKFKTAKKDLIQQQINLKQNYEKLLVLKAKLKQLGGRDFKLETLEVIEFIGCGNENAGGDHQRLGSGDYSDTKANDFEQEIKRIHTRVNDCLLKIIELNSDIHNQIQESGTEELNNNCLRIFMKIQEYVKTLTNEHDSNTQFLLETFQQFKTPFMQETHDIHSTNNEALQEEIASLKETTQQLEVQSKMLQSEVDVKNREIQYLISKESCRESCANEGSEQQNDFRSEIENQKRIIDEFTIQLEQHSWQNEMYEEKIKQLEAKTRHQDEQMQANLLKYEVELSQKSEKCEELSKMLDEAKTTHFENLQDNAGSNYENISNQLATANEDVKELKFIICKREKQIQNLKQLLSAETIKAKEYDHLSVKFEELLNKENCKSEEINQLKEKLAVKTDTINGQNLTISELKKMLMAQGTTTEDYSKDKSVVGPLEDEKLSKFAKQERIIEKLEKNKIRSNTLRDQLLDRISVLENEKEDLKAQIRKFHEDFTINRFMYDEQRRKKRLTDILVKQYQK